MAFRDLTKEPPIGDWTPEEFDGAKGGVSRWWCRCACGTRRKVLTSNLVNGRSLGCGCRKNERIGQASTKHGHAAGGKISSEYTSWRDMMMRCHQPKNEHYPEYGGRGITVCDSWRTSFQAFLDDMGLKPSPKHSIDRLDNNKSYEKGNCQWADRFTQANNKRNNRLVTFRGQTLSLSQWSRAIGINRKTIEYRLFRHGWSVERALTEPVNTGPVNRGTSRRRVEGP